MGDAEALSSAIATLEEKGHILRGAFHTAGALQDELIQLKGAANAGRVLSSKIDTTIALDKALQGFELDFVMLFSSMSVEMGLHGQVDYSAANAFLDTFAEQRRQEGKPYLAVSWTAWENAFTKSAGRSPLRHSFFTSEIQVANKSTYFFLAGTDRQWLLDEHRNAANQAIIPGTAYLDFAALAYMQQKGSSYPLLIDNASFIELCAVTDQQRKFVGVSLAPGNDGTYEVSVGNVSETIEHARAVVGPSALTSETLDIESVKARCKPGDEAILVDNYVNFGPRWMCSKHAWFGESEALVEVERDAAFVADLEIHPLHPAMLDVAIAGPQSIAGFDAEKDFLVPFTYGTVHCFGPIPQHIFSHVVMRKDGNHNPDFVTFDVTISSPDGKEIMRVEGFTMRRLDPSVFADPFDLSDESDLETGIADEEGMQVLGQLTTQLGHGRIAVSPTSPKQLIARCMSEASALVVAVDDSQLASRPSLSTPFVEPESDTAISIAHAWSKALGIGKIGVDDNFFELGGHSLLLTRVSAVVQKEPKKRVSLEDLFETPTIAIWEGVFDGAGQAQTDAQPKIKRVERKKYKS